MKGALLSEFYLWRHKRIWLTLVMLAGAVACSASEILFIFLFGIMPIMNFVSGMLAFKGENSQAVEEFNMSVPITRAQRIAAKYIVLLCENVVMWLGYIFVCLLVKTDLISENYDEYEVRTAMKYRVIFMVCTFAVAFVLWFLLNCKPKKHRVLVNVLLFLPFSFIMWYAHMEFEFLCFSSIFRDELWILPSAVVSAVLLLAAGVPLAVWRVNRKECGRKMKRFAVACVALVIVFTASFILLDEYGYFNWNAPLGFIYNGQDEYEDEYEYEPEIPGPPTEEELAVRASVLDFLDETDSVSFAGESLSYGTDLLEGLGFEIENQISLANAFKDGILCSLYCDMILSSLEDSVMNDSIPSFDSEKEVNSFRMTAQTGVNYFESLTSEELEKMTSQFRICQSGDEITQAFRNTGLVPDTVTELLSDSDSAPNRGYIVSVFAEDFEGEGTKEITLNISAMEGKVISATYSL